MREIQTMSIFTRLAEFGSAYRKARRNADAIRYINSLPPELRKDIGWPAGPGSRVATRIRDV
jgi:hypothetical protein